MDCEWPRPTAISHAEVILTPVLAQLVNIQAHAVVGLSARGHFNDHFPSFKLLNFQIDCRTLVFILVTTAEHIHIRDTFWFDFFWKKRESFCF